LLNGQGKVEGLLVLTVPGGRECFALPCLAVERILRDFRQFGRARHGWVGIAVVEGRSTPTGERTVLVNHLFEGTPAAQSGVLPGDRVISIGDREIKSPKDVLDAGFFSHTAQEVPVKVQRNGQEIQVLLAIAARPETSAIVQLKLMQENETMRSPFVSPSDGTKEPPAIKVNDIQK
jgi:S1-C subfamily serine protease